MQHLPSSLGLSWFCRCFHHRIRWGFRFDCRLWRLLRFSNVVCTSAGCMFVGCGRCPSIYSRRRLGVLRIGMFVYRVRIVSSWRIGICSRRLMSEFVCQLGVFGVLYVLDELVFVVVMDFIAIRRSYMSSASFNSAIVRALYRMLASFVRSCMPSVMNVISSISSMSVRLAIDSISRTYRRTVSFRFHFRLRSCS